jgi:choice-of-anchor A domain-containing protein
MAKAQEMDPGLDRIWITDDETRMIYEFTTNWELVNLFGYSLPGSPPNIRSSAIAVDPTTIPRTLWVVREFPGTLVNLTRNGNVLSTIGTQSLFDAWGPEGVDVDPFNGSLWFVTDPNYNHTPADPGVPAVYNITRDGNLVRSFPTSDFDPESTSPQSIAVDPVDGSLWIVDNLADQIYHITNEGGLINSISTQELIPSSTNPQGITVAIDKTNGTLWVTDRFTHRVFNLTRDGDQLSSFDLSSIDLEANTILNPTGIAYERVLIGEAGDFAVLGLAGAKIMMKNGNPSVIGDVGLGPNGEQNLKAGIIAGTLFVDPTAENEAPGIVIEGGIEVRDLNQVAINALLASSNAANLTPTQVFSKIDGTQTIERTGPQTVIAVEKIELKDGSTLTLSGGLTDQFIINISTGLKLNNGSVIQLNGGLQVGNVLFNFVNQGALVDIKGSSSASGIILAPQIDTTVKLENPGTTFTGAVIAAGEISIKKDAQVIFDN